ncbi:MAG: ribonuclease J [Caldilineales bacterium]|nr:ribonuclease J [Caldilineales bacterium]
MRIIPLGGLGEFGKNMMVYESADAIFVIDTGVMFPEEDMPGIDVVIPNISYLLDNQTKVKGIILSHGHEDHIGALPYILRQINVPVYGTRLTLGLAENKLREHRLHNQTDLRVIDDESVIEMGSFRLEFVHLCHSIPDAIGVVIHSPAGVLLHMTDFKFDAHPADGRLTDEARLRQLGDAGVRMLLSDSTNAEVAGFTPSEQELERVLDDLIGRAQGRVIIATFASNISRVQQVINVANRHGRKVGVTGRSMVNNTKMAIELGYLQAPPDGLLTADQMNYLPPERVVIVCTGSQGEPTSALVRMSRGQYRHLRLGKGDTVIISAAPIPGNEKMIHHTLDDLFRLGADILYDELFDVHVSGHGSRSDMKHMLELTRPQHVVPIHGEYRQLVLHARLAEETGIPAEKITIIENGQTLEVGPDWVMPDEVVASGRVFVDGLGVGDVGSVVLRDRRHLARDGFLVVIIGLDQENGEVILGPEILSRGFVYMAESEMLIEEAKEVVWDVLERQETAADVADGLHAALGDYCYRTTGRRPMIMPLVVEL